MNKIISIFSEMHLYSGKMEYIIKLLVWIICWIGGIYVVKDLNVGVGSAYFIFSLALLMEFTPRIHGKNELVTRILLSLFCFAIGSILVISAIILFTAEYNENLHTTMFIISICVMAYMLLDCFILCVSKEDNISDIENSSENNDDRVQKFNENLNTGNLGSINAR